MLSGGCLKLGRLVKAAWFNHRALPRGTQQTAEALEHSTAQQAAALSVTLSLEWRNEDKQQLSMSDRTLEGPGGAQVQASH